MPAKTTLKTDDAASRNGAVSNLYTEGIQEIIKLSEDDNYAKRVDNGPLKEARGKDTWQVHSQLHALNRVNQNVAHHAASIETHLNDLDGHLDAASELLGKLVTQAGKQITGVQAANLETIGNWITSARKALADTSAANQKEVLVTVKESTRSLQTQVTEVQETVTDRLESVHKSIKAAFAELARATAGSEENIRAQTESFSKAVELLLNDVRGDLDSKIAEFRDDATRLIDKRFNQSDVSFAAVRADQEVIKALLTDIIKDRLGRAEPRVR